MRNLTVTIPAIKLLTNKWISQVMMMPTFRSHGVVGSKRLVFSSSVVIHQSIMMRIFLQRGGITIPFLISLKIVSAVDSSSGPGRDKLCELTAATVTLIRRGLIFATAPQRSLEDQQIPVLTTRLRRQSGARQRVRSA